MGRKAKAQEQVVEANPVGRPTNYDPSFIPRIIEYGKNGMSLVEIASKLEISRASLYDWAEQYPEFSTALTRAREDSQAWWEEQGRLGIFPDKKKVDANLWFRNITNRFKKDWGQPKTPEVDSGDIIDVKPVAIDADKLDPEKRELLKSLLMELREIGESDNDHD